MTRRSAGYSDPVDFALDAGLMPERYALIERGRTEPKLLELIAIAEITEKSLDWLLRGTVQARD